MSLIYTSTFMRQIQYLIDQYEGKHYLAVFIPSSVSQQSIALRFIHQQITNTNGLLNNSVHCAQHKCVETLTTELLVLQSIANEVELQQERMDIPSNGLIVFTVCDDDASPIKEMVSISFHALIYVVSFDYICHKMRHIQHDLLNVRKIDVASDCFAVYVLNSPHRVRLSIHDLYIGLVHRDCTQLLFHQRKRMSLKSLLPKRQALSVVWRRLGLRDIFNRYSRKYCLPSLQSMPRVRGIIIAATRNTCSKLLLSKLIPNLNNQIICYIHLKTPHLHHDQCGLFGFETVLHKSAAIIYEDVVLICGYLRNINNDYQMFIIPDIQECVELFYSEWMTEHCNAAIAMRYRRMLDPYLKQQEVMKYERDLIENIKIVNMLYLAVGVQETCKAIELNNVKYIVMTHVKLRECGKHDLDYGFIVTACDQKNIDLKYIGVDPDALTMLQRVLKGCVAVLRSSKYNTKSMRTKMKNRQRQREEQKRNKQVSNEIQSAFQSHSSQPPGFYYYDNEYA
eukprot:374721_1